MSHARPRPPGAATLPVARGPTLMKKKETSSPDAGRPRLGALRAPHHPRGRGGRGSARFARNGGRPGVSSLASLRSARSDPRGGARPTSCHPGRRAEILPASPRSGEGLHVLVARAHALAPADSPLPAHPLRGRASATPRPRPRSSPSSPTPASAARAAGSSAAPARPLRRPSPPLSSWRFAPTGATRQAASLGGTPTVLPIGRRCGTHRRACAPPLRSGPPGRGQVLAEGAARLRPVGPSRLRRSGACPRRRPLAHRAADCARLPAMRPPAVASSAPSLRVAAGVGAVLDAISPARSSASTTRRAVPAAPLRSVTPLA